jgi:uncharacterized protein DUF5996
MKTGELTTAERDRFWPPLPFQEWQDTAQTLRLWTQIVGKVRLTLSPWINHSWGVTLYVTSRGLTTSPIPYGLRTFEIEFDFIDHQLRILTSDGSRREIELGPHSVAFFYNVLIRELNALDLSVSINRVPNEIPEVIPFDQDETHHSYDREYSNRFWRVLVQANRVFKRFRSRFCGKCSPVHFFWGSFDLAVTRFSGRQAPPHPGGVPHLPDAVVREGYAQELCSLGFWPGDAANPAAFYSYAYPEPKNFGAQTIRPNGAFYSAQLHEFLLPYEIVRVALSPDEAILQFAQTAYDAAAALANWDSEALDEARLRPPIPIE